MFQLRNLNGAVRRDDNGIAVVAAIGVAFILMVILTIVVSVTIVTTNNSGRDRVRTASIHSAEGALDSAMAEMEQATPCGAPSFSPLSVGSGSQETIVTVDIVYYSDEFVTPILCSGGSLATDAKYATITATAVPAHAVGAVQPSRTIEARVAVTSRGATAKLPGIYAGQDMYLEGTPDFFSPDADASPDIWVDRGDLHCWPTINRQTEIEADVVVGQGNADLEEWCWFVRDLFVGGNMTWSNSAASNTSQVNYRCNNKFICGDLTIGGNLSIASNAERLTTGGNVDIGGVLTGSSSNYLIADGAVNQNVSSIAPMPVRGFPTVEYVYANWLNAYGMQPGTLTDFTNLLNFKSGQYCTGRGWRRTCTTFSYDASDVANCDFDSQYYDSTIVLPSTPMVYDLRSCDGNATTTTNDVMKFSSTNTIEVNADTAFIVSGFFNSGTLNFVSGDGNRHNIWFIVSDEGVPAYNGYTSCNSPTVYSLCSTYILTSTAETPILWYTKHLFYSNGASNSVNDMYGQLFAGSVYFKGYLDLQFETLSIPGEILWQAGAPGFDVQLLSKREIPTT